jgi:hypothetical protein
MADNASNNNTLVDELGELLDGFGGSLTRVRCFAHILNLVVKVTPVTERLTYQITDGDVGYSVTIQPEDKGNN